MTEEDFDEKLRIEYPILHWFLHMYDDENPEYTERERNLMEKMDYKEED